MKHQRAITDVEAEALTEAFEAIGKIRRRNGFTLRDVMVAMKSDHRTAIKLMQLLERIGALSRSGGGPGEALVWTKTGRVFDE